MWEAAVYALFVAVSPLPIVVVILMLLGSNGLAAASAFVLGRILTLLVVVAVLAAIVDEADSASSKPTWTSWLRVGVAVLLFVLAWRKWRGHRSGLDSGDSQLPGWMASVGDLPPTRAILVAAVLVVANPKELLLALAAAAALGSARLGVAAGVVASLAFSLLATVVVAAPVVTVAVRGARMEPTLERWRAWLTRNHKLLVAVVLVVIGFLVLGNGISGLRAA